MLMIIIGFSDFLLAALEDGDRRHADALEIRRAAERASALTRQLLAFGGPQQQPADVVDLNRVVDDMARMLRPLLGESIALVTAAARPLAGVEADRGQIEQVIMNLALNARDAMPEGGELAIETYDTELGEGEAYRQVGIDIPAGRYVMLVVRDTGVGMDEPVRSRVFEPFFTTKGSSRNSGLGLATVYGIVTQSGGYIWLDSAPGQGTVFRICFPAASADAADRDTAGHAAPMRGGSETVLVVEDEASVRNLAVRALEEQGYRVRSAGNGRAALHLLETQPAHPVDLLITDVVMPEMGGRELVERAVRLRPDLEVLFISGYTNTEGPGRDMRDTGFPLLQKPFSPESLVRRVRELLDRRVTPVPPA
jgi:CheY-like chemotaxis protein